LTKSTSEEKSYLQKVRKLWNCSLISLFEVNYSTHINVIFHARFLLCDSCYLGRLNEFHTIVCNCVFGCTIIFS
jgi:hypothetical protein